MDTEKKGRYGDNTSLGMYPAAINLYDILAKLEDSKEAKRAQRLIAKFYGVVRVLSYAYGHPQHYYLLKLAYDDFCCRIDRSCYSNKVRTHLCSVIHSIFADECRGTESKDRHDKKARDAARTKFVRLADEWEHYVGPSSNIEHICMHQSYQAIIGMGPIAVPFILYDLQHEGPNHWFWALHAITGENPVLEAHLGDMRAMTEDWLKWGKAQGYI